MSLQRKWSGRGGGPCKGSGAAGSVGVPRWGEGAAKSRGAGGLAGKGARRECARKREPLTSAEQNALSRALTKKYWVSSTEYQGKMARNSLTNLWDWPADGFSRTQPQSLDRQNPPSEDAGVENQEKQNRFSCKGKVSRPALGEKVSYSGRKAQIGIYLTYMVRSTGAHYTLSDGLAKTEFLQQ